MGEVTSNKGSVKSLSTTSVIGVGGRRLAIDKNFGKDEETTKELCKGIETPDITMVGWIILQW